MESRFNLVSISDISGNSNGLKSSDFQHFLKLFISWFQLIGRSEHGVLTKLQLLFDSERNWERLREHLNSAKLPCIPYLGNYLS